MLAQVVQRLEQVPRLEEEQAAVRAEHFIIQARHERLEELALMV